MYLCNLFSSPKLTAQWAFLMACRLSVNFSIFIFFSRTTGTTKLNTKHLGWRGFKFVQMKDHTHFQGEIIPKIGKYIDKIKKILSQFQPNLAQYIFGWRGVKFVQINGPCPFPRWNNYEIAKICWQNLKIFSRTTGPISTKFGTVHPWVKGSQVCSNEGPHLFPGGDNYKIAKIHLRRIKVFFSKSLGQFQPNLAQCILGWRGFKLVLLKVPLTIHRREINCTLTIKWLLSD